MFGSRGSLTILRELNLRRIFSAVYFVNTNIPGERVAVLLPEKKLSELPEDCPNIPKKSNIDSHFAMENTIFFNNFRYHTF